MSEKTSIVHDDNDNAQKTIQMLRVMRQKGVSQYVQIERAMSLAEMMFS